MIVRANFSDASMCNFERIDCYLSLIVCSVDTIVPLRFGGKSAYAECSEVSVLEVQNIFRSDIDRHIVDTKMLKISKSIRPHFRLYTYYVHIKFRSKRFSQFLEHVCMQTRKSKTFLIEFAECDDDDESFTHACITCLEREI